MTLLTICIPVTAPADTLMGNVREMLTSEREDVEVLIGDFAGGTQTALQDLADAVQDPRVRVIPAAPEARISADWEISAGWNALIPEARGAWISIIGAQDYLDPELGAVIAAMVRRVPDADALSWGRARYVPPTLRQGQEIAIIPTGSRMLLPEQKDMMRAQFYWETAGDRPDCHFSAWHGAVRRDLLERTREAFSDVYFEQPSPAIDSACKTIMLARRMVHWERPLSVQTGPLAPCGTRDDQGDQRFADFPFSARTGPAAAAALAIEAFKRRYGIELEGWEDNFLKACARDCETAATGETFHAKKTAYAHEIMAWRGKRGLAAFRPEFRRKPKIQRFKGVMEDHLHFDMEMDSTRTAADFYRLIDAMLFPVRLLDDKLA
ncbi:hypothetical protein [Hoeflea sp.]|uniref:hypothetical protein n=1 Tax=Hoeflea sp. TaxID=1940281 RepID=UPI0019B9149B|nr:hypothetical protein [Hoeflea sp.]MBC7281973.1 hypothetical protein [Hoeflea sp.]